MERTWEKQYSLFKKQDVKKENMLKDSIQDNKEIYREITLRKIEQSNYEECIELNVNENQDK